MADPANSTLGRMLLDEISPVVMVLRTPLVEESCQKNGLSFIEMLSPFSSFNNIDVPVRTASDQPYRLKKFKLRLFYASDIRQPNIEVAKEHLRRVISHAGERDVSELCSDPPRIETLLTNSQLAPPPSWFQYFNKELVRVVSFSEHEAFDHPVACLLVVSSKDEDPINKFVDLFNTNQLPSLLNDGAMDPKILKQYVLVHDNQDGISEKTTKILTEMRNTFGANDCRLLCMNSSADRSTEHHENPWASYKFDVPSGQKLGCFLNMDDVDELRNVMHDLSSKHIIPYMEQKIRVLNQQVSATRKGFRNQIKNLWWRKGKEDTTDNLNGPVYTFSSIESQIRVLGDYAFMLRDYELALSNYRLLSTDYKLDKSWKRYAGVQEMMGLTYFMLDQSRKDAEFCMETAFSTYSKIGSSGQPNSTRCGLWWVEMLKAREQYKEAATVYFRISGEEPLHTAVMLEQASYCYLFSTPPMLRKYGFHLVLSGDLYKKCDQIKHAIRTYRSALSVFEGNSWSHIRDHVHFHIGMWYSFLGMCDVAVKHMLEVLACGHQSKTKQEIFLREFFETVQKTGKLHDVPKLQLPIINMPSLKVVFEDHRTYASHAAVKVKENMWESLEEDMVPSLSSAKTNWLELQSKILPKKYKESNVCLIDEAITVKVEFQNPLQIPIPISNVSLVCKHSASTDELEPDVASSVVSNDDVSVLTTSGEFSYNTSFTLSEVDITLGAGERVMIHLMVTPKVEGAIEIVGVRWKLTGSVVGFCNFSASSLRKKVTKGKRKLKHSMGVDLKFLVIKSLPKLEGIIHDFPKKLYAGDLRRLALELKNPSKIAVKNLKMKISSPRFLNIGSQEDMNVEFPAYMRKKANISQSDIQGRIRKAANNVFLFPEDTVIHGENPLVWPLWLHSAIPGNVSIYMSIYYEMGDVSNLMTYRILRMHYNLEVLPSLDVSFQISPRPSGTQEFLVQMDVANRTSSEVFQIHQLSSVGKQWEISLLQPVDTIVPMEPLWPGQAMSSFFKLKNCRNLVTTEDKVPSGKEDVILDCGSSEELFDIDTTPLTDFHLYERMHQGMSDQKHQNTADFILISNSWTDSKVEQPKRLNIFSHHICCSVTSTNPIWWLVDGPRTVKHNFDASFCEVKLRMAVYNSSENAALVRVITPDSVPTIGSLIAASPVPGNEAGWHDLSMLNDVKASSEVPRSRVGKSLFPEGVSSFIWSGTSSTIFKLEPFSSTEVPLQVCIFSPGVFDLSNYSLHWSFCSSNDLGEKAAGLRPSSGACQGHPHYLTVLQQK